MKNRISILTLCLLLLWSVPVLAEALPEAPGGETAVTLTYTTGYTLPTDVPYDPNFHFDLTGQVRYEDDTPYSQRFMELHSQVKRALTDRSGGFGMRQVEQGAHTLKALGADNAVQGTLRFRIDRTNTVDSTAMLTLPDGTTELLANASVTALHLVLKLDGQGNLILTEVHAATSPNELSAATANPPTGRLDTQTAPLTAVLLMVTLLSIIKIKQNN